MAPTTRNREQENHRRAVEYLVDVLRKNPLEEGAEVIARRTRLLGLNASTSQAAVLATQIDLRQRREAILKIIDELRSNFWSVPLSEIHAKLEKLDADDFPDLHAAVARLQIVAAHRSQFPKLTSLRQFDPDFWNVFKEVLISSPKDGAIAKERVLASFSTGQNRRRGQKMVKLLANQVPDVYSLEASWLGTLARHKASTSRQYATAPKPQGSTVLSGGSGIPWWLIFVIGSAVLRAIFSASKH